VNGKKRDPNTLHQTAILFALNSPGEVAGLGDASGSWMILTPAWVFPANRALPAQPDVVRENYSASLQTQRRTSALQFTKSQAKNYLSLRSFLEAQNLNSRVNQEVFLNVLIAILG
jgi:hypothetical protein